MTTMSFDNGVPANVRRASPLKSAGFIGRLLCARPLGPAQVAERYGVTSSVKFARV